MNSPMAASSSFTMAISIKSTWVRFHSGVARSVDSPLNADAIVNAANKQLKHGSGIAEAIRKAGGGDEFQLESDKIIKERGKSLADNEAVWQKPSGALAGRVKGVIHVAGPDMQGTGNDYTEKDGRHLESAVDASLQYVQSTVTHVITTNRLANEKGYESVAIPAISTGIFGFNKEQCASVYYSR